jgi:hypothetical protein
MKNTNMKRHLSVIGMVTLLLAFGLSGCIQNNEGQVSGGDKFELVSYSVESWKCRNEEVDKGDNSVQMVHIEKKIADDFIYNKSVDEYRIEGKVKNIAGYKTNLKIKMNFYDQNDIFLDSYAISIKNIPENYERLFSKRLDDSDIEHFEKVDSVKFEFVDLKNNQK